MELEVEERVSELEIALRRLTAVIERSIIESRRETQAFKREMLEFKDEMREFKDEMLEFKDEMREFKIESKTNQKEMNKKWGDLANKMGTLVEDIVAPNIPRIASEYFQCNIINKFIVRCKIRNSIDNSKSREFDTIAVTDNYFFINETKSTPRTEYIKDFIGTLKELHEYFPEYRELKVIPIFSSLYIPEDMINYLTKNKIYALAMKDDSMEIINFNEMEIGKEKIVL